MKSLDCNQINIFINLEIIGEEDKHKKIIFTFLNYKKNSAIWYSHLAQQIYIYIYIYLNLKKKL